MFGTGCCIFSKHPIVDTFLHRFALNGYAHRPQHGDWFGGKGVGLARLIVNGDTVNVYCTHVSTADTRSWMIMCEDKSSGVEIRGCPIVRDHHFVMKDDHVLTDVSPSDDLIFVLIVLLYEEGPLTFRRDYHVFQRW
jgi:hypothetical protein